MVDLEEMIRIPGGTFIMGTDEREIDEMSRTFRVHRSWFLRETPRRDVYVADFLIDKYPVTRGQYARFVRETGHRPPLASRLEEPGDADMHPVVGVRWADANAYAKWAGKRLPTAAEWEKAARGTDGRTWSWGNEWNPNALNWNPNEQRDARRVGTRPVYSYPEGVSPYGVWDMCGNVAEWTADGYLGDRVGSVKSGGWLTSQPYNLRPAFGGFSQWAENASPFIGFRCAT